MARHSTHTRHLIPRFARAMTSRIARGPNVDLIPCDGPPGFDPDELSARASWTQVGDGSFGKVFKGDLLGEPVAIKVTANARPDRIAGLKRDLWYLSSFSHPNITRVYGGFIEGGDAHMVMEYVPHSLRSKRVVNETNRVKVLADIARALTRVHAAGHVHRDVKARNVLISEDYKTAKLTDFGLARVISGGAMSREDVNPQLTPKIGPPKYRAPEVERGKPYDASSDVYGYGVMCFQLIEQLRRRTRKSNTAEVEFIRELGRLAMQKDPTKRPTALQCLTMCMSWLRGGDDVITPDIYPGRKTYRENYWVREPMDGGTWKQPTEPSKSHSESESEPEAQSPSHSADKAPRDDGLRANGIIDPGVRSIDAQRGRKREEPDGSDTPVSKPKRVNSTSADLCRTAGKIEGMRIAE